MPQPYGTPSPLYSPAPHSARPAVLQPVRRPGPPLRVSDGWAGGPSPATSVSFCSAFYGPWRERGGGYESNMDWVGRSLVRTNQMNKSLFFFRSVFFPIFRFEKNSFFTAAITEIVPIWNLRLFLLRCFISEFCFNSILSVSSLKIPAP